MSRSFTPERPGETAAVVDIRQLHQRLTSLLQDHRALRQTVKECWEVVPGSDRGLGLRGLEDLCAEVQRRIGLPAEAFGDLADTFSRFDFNGNGSLELNEAYRCVKSSMANFRKMTGGDPPANVPFSTPEEAGYTLVRVLASGGQGQASLVRSANGKEVVLKSYSRDNENAGGLEDLLDEAANMREMAECDNVAHCYDIFQDDTNLYMISGANYGGDWSKLKRATAREKGIPMTESWFRTIFRQAFHGLSYMHSNAVMHCDIKEPNLMFKDTNFAEPMVVIIDLGLSQAMAQEDQGPCGTPGYIPPETWETGKWYPRGDMFSMGVVCCQVLCDKIPDEDGGTPGIFSEDCKTMDDIIAATRTRPPPYSLLSLQSADLLRWLVPCLDRQKDCRPRAPQVLEMPWFTGRDAAGLDESEYEAKATTLGVRYRAEPRLVQAKASIFYKPVPAPLLQTLRLKSPPRSPSGRSVRSPLRSQAVGVGLR